MRSFSESLRITKNIKLLEQALVLMADKGIDPEKFINWYVEDGQFEENLVLNEFLNKWFPTATGLANRASQGYSAGSSVEKPSASAEYMGSALGSAAQGLAKRIGSWASSAKGAGDSFTKGVIGDQPQQNQTQQGSTATSVQAQPQMTPLQKSQAVAKHALDTLSKRLGVSKDLQNKVADPEFHKNIINLIGLLKNSLEESVQTQFFDEDLEIKKQLFELQNQGIDVVVFTEWYVNNYSENWLQKAGDWLGNQWANVKSAWSNWGKAGQQRQAGVDAERDVQSITLAMSALRDLKSKLGDTNVNQDFTKTLNSVIEKLGQMGNQAPQNTQTSEPTVPASDQQQPEKNIGDGLRRQRMYGDHNIPDQEFLNSILGRGKDNKFTWFG
jgi:SOS response regulatory protein OraA/RecX